MNALPVPPTPPLPVQPALPPDGSVIAGGFQSVMTDAQLPLNVLGGGAAGPLAPSGETPGDQPPSDARPRPAETPSA